MRYEVLVKRGRKVIASYQREDYKSVMHLLEFIEETMADTYTVEYRDLLVHGRR